MHDKLKISDSVKDLSELEKYGVYEGWSDTAKIRISKDNHYIYHDSEFSLNDWYIDDLSVFSKLCRAGLVEEVKDE